MKIYINVYTCTFTVNKIHTKPDDGSRGRKEETYMSNKIRRDNFPKSALLCVSLVCRIIISKISLLQYVTPQQKIRHCC